GNRPHFGADQPRRPQPRRSMRWADVYVCMLADGVALRKRCPEGQADPRAAIADGASGVTMARAGPHPRRGRHSGQRHDVGWRRHDVEMPRGIFARLLELAHEEGDALLENAVVPPSRRLTAPRRRRSSATRKRASLFASSATPPSTSTKPRTPSLPTR